MFRSFRDRDYFRTTKSYVEHGLNGRETIHVSRVFRSEYDNQFKFVIACPVRDDDGKFLGVVEASIPMDDSLGLQTSLLYSDVQQAVLVGLVDKNPARAGAAASDFAQHEALVVVHEEFEAKDRETGIPLDDLPQDVFEALGILGQPELENAPADKLLQIAPDLDYRDPVEPSRRMVAGFSRVGQTGLLVVVQQPYEAAVGRPTTLAQRYLKWGWSAIGLAFLLAGTLVWSRARMRRRSSPVP